MSKVDAQRAMRQARYEALEAQASAARPPAPASAPGPALDEPEPAVRSVRGAGTRTAVATKAPDEPAADEPLCGHRSIGNKSCQRPAGHAEKNHRYK